MMNETIIHFDNASEARDIEALLDGLIETIESSHQLLIILRDLKLILQGPEPAVAKATRFIEQVRVARNRTALTNQSIRYACELFFSGEEEVFARLASIRIDVSPRKPAIYPKTLGQQIYLDAITNHAISFGIGPAGTGKTYLAMAMAISALLKEEVSRIVLTRPAIEAGESLGFLPGDLQQKVLPYLRPLYDALRDMMPAESIDNYIERGIIEVAPLAYMRGRTLNNAFVILDEAQNTTCQQMFMFLTRLGFESKCAITGDITQIDLPKHHLSGLLEARSVLKKVKGISFIEMTERDVVRHPLVQRVIEAYQQKRNA
jgi:phosphate starvation-inducible protein PhoH and related proteins